MTDRSEEARHTEGWKQVRAGLALIRWSQLANWSTVAAQLKPQTNFDKFKSHHESVEPKYGRLLCWIAFEVGSEYVIKGVCLLCSAFPLGDYVPLGKMTSYMSEALGDSTEREQVLTDVKTLRKKRRNTDLHGYEEGVRDDWFPCVQTAFVPALNTFLRRLDATELRKAIKSSTSQ